jgi:hypothetical protein
VGANRGARAASFATSMASLPSFSSSDVALLISAIEQALERLYRANEDVGGADPELLEYGRRYSVLLEKLQAVARAS